MHLLVFTLSDQRYALILSGVERVVRSAEAAPLPKAPPVVTGIINVQGEILPVMNLRQRFKLRARSPDIRDHMVIAKTSRRKVILPVEAVVGVLDFPEEQIVPSDQIAPHIEYVRGVAKLINGIVLIHDLDTFLSLDEQAALDEALQ
ncbi:MAG: purine-binding chemotaxis protein CheW [Ignavibacterium sp.]|jgi:purine-binding chemotaxis protein CheW